MEGGLGFESHFLLPLQLGQLGLCAAQLILQICDLYAQLLSFLLGSGLLILEHLSCITCLLLIGLCVVDVCALLAIGSLEGLILFLCILKFASQPLELQLLTSSCAHAVVGAGAAIAVRQWAVFEVSRQFLMRHPRAVPLSAPT